MRHFLISILHSGEIWGFHLLFSMYSCNLCMLRWNVELNLWQKGTLLNSVLHVCVASHCGPLVSRLSWKEHGKPTSLICFYCLYEVMNYLNPSRLTASLPAESVSSLEEYFFCCFSGTGLEIQARCHSPYMDWLLGPRSHQHFLVQP